MKHMKLIALLICITVLVCSLAGCAKTAALSFELNGGAASDLPEEFTNNAALALPNPTRQYYAFKGWSLNSDGSGTLYAELPAEMELSDEQVESGLKLYAVWERLTGKVTFDLGAGAWEEGYSPITSYKYGEVTALDGEPVLKHFEFDGWTLNGESVDELTADQTGDVVLVAVWEQVETRINFDLGGLEGATIDADEDETFDTEDGCELGDYIPESTDGSIFAGWFATAEDAANPDAEPITFIPEGTKEEVTVYARWASPVNVPGGDNTWVPNL